MSSNEKIAKEIAQDLVDKFTIGTEREAFVIREDYQPFLAALLSAEQRGIEMARAYHLKRAIDAHEAGNYTAAERHEGYALDLSAIRSLASKDNGKDAG